MKSLVKIRDADALTTGLFPSLPDNQLALWKEGQNVLFYNARVEKLKGVQLEAVVAEGTIVAMIQAFADDQNRVYYGTSAGKLYKWAGGLQDEIGTGFGTQWSLEVFGTFLLATDGEAPLQVWENTANAVPLEGVNFDWAKIVRKLENHIVVFNTSIDDQEVRWCSKSNIELWDPAVNNSAGGYPVRDLDSGIVAAERFGNALGFYSSNAFGTVQYVGKPFWFSVTKQLQGIGAVSKDAIVSVNDEHYGFGPEGIFRNNGVSFLYVDTPAVKSFIKEMADPAEYATLRGVHYQAKNLVAWAFTCFDDLRRGVAFDYVKQSWTIISGPYTAFDEPVLAIPGVEGKPVAALGNRWGFFDTGTASVSDQSGITTASLDAGDVDRWKRWDMVRFESEVSGGLEIRFGFAEKPGDPEYWTGWSAFSRESWIDQESIYLTMELRSTDPTATWAITGLEIFGEKTGWDR